MVIKRSPGGPCRWRSVNFEIHLWSSGMNADCIWRSICIQHVQIEAGLNSDPGNDSFWDKSVTLTILIDLLTSTSRSTQVKIASTDLWPQGMFTFSEMLALVGSESSFGAYVCHRRPGGSLATSDIVGGIVHDQSVSALWNIHSTLKTFLWPCILWLFSLLHSLFVLQPKVAAHTVFEPCCMPIASNTWQ